MYLFIHLLLVCLFPFLEAPKQALICDDTTHIHEATYMTPSTRFVRGMSQLGLHLSPSEAPGIWEGRAGSRATPEPTYSCTAPLDHKYSLVNYTERARD